MRRWWAAARGRVRRAAAPSPSRWGQAVSCASCARRASTLRLVVGAEDHRSGGVAEQNVQVTPLGVALELRFVERTRILAVEDVPGLLAVGHQRAVDIAAHQQHSLGDAAADQRVFRLARIKQVRAL